MCAFSSVPSSYLHALECYVAAKQEFLSNSTSGDPSSDNLTTLYDYQHKYVNALLKQLPPGTAWPATDRVVPIHPPTTIKNPRARQGPFLLQPAPLVLEGSEGGDATDIVYLSFGNDAAEESEGETERLGLVLVVFQDGKVDLYLDVEKVEARWELKQVRFRLAHRTHVWVAHISDDSIPPATYRCSRHTRVSISAPSPRSGKRAGRYVCSPC